MASCFRGITVKQFKDTLESMKKIYNYDDEKTRLSSCIDLIRGGIGEVEIMTIDNETGVLICMTKKVETSENEREEDPLWCY